MTEFNPQRKRSFMREHELEDAEAAYVDAVYRFRKAESLGSIDYCAARVNMNRLEVKIRELKYGY